MLCIYLEGTFPKEFIKKSLQIQMNNKLSTYKK